MSDHLIITIGRECGSGGRNIGKKLAEEMGVKCYDKELLTRAAKESGLCRELFETHDEKPTNSFLYSLVMDTYSLGYTNSAHMDMPINHKIFLAQFDTIKKLASEESCVIIGRCADYVLDGTEGLIRVFLYADIKVREERVRERNLYADKDVLKNIHRIDRERRDYNRYYAGRDWEKPENYDLLINTTQIGVDGSVQLIKDYLKMRGLL